jgi:outer membrane receptor protein involved in Fe transport
MNGKDEIISVRLPDDSQVNQNAGQTRHLGVEYAAVVRPISALTLRLGGSNAVHEFVRHEEQGVTLDGNAMPAAPDWVANGEVAYSPAFVPDARVALEWQHVGPYWMDPANTTRYGGYDLLNLRASYRLAGAELWLQVLNLTDAHYATTASRGRFGDAYNAGAPRTLVAGVRYGLP